jgi:hypothetical protein
MNKEKQIEGIAQYYVLRNKDTGMYFRGKGVNRWGKYFNQATIYRVKGTAEASVREVSWHGEKAEVVPIQIFENEAGYAKASEVAREIFEEIEEGIEAAVYALQFNNNPIHRNAKHEAYSSLMCFIKTIKEEYTEEGK